MNRRMIRLGQRIVNILSPGLTVTRFNLPDVYIQPYLPLPTPPRAATTLLAAGLLVSTFDWVELFLVAGAVFLLTRDFFSIAICRFSRF
jgi:hypothetical protein